LHPGPLLTQPSILSGSENATGYSWEGIRQVRATLLGARHVYLSAFVVAMSTWGAISSVQPLPFHLYLSDIITSSLQ